MSQPQPYCSQFAKNLPNKSSTNISDFMPTKMDNSIPTTETASTTVTPSSAVRDPNSSTPAVVTPVDTPSVMPPASSPKKPVDKYKFFCNGKPYVNLD